MLVTPLLAVLAACAPAGNAAPPPAGIGAAVAAGDRPAAMVALDRSRKPGEVLTYVGVKRGHHVLDVMAGRGYYAEIVARAIGAHGSVIAQEPTFADADVRASLDALVSRAPNVHPLYVMPAALSLPADSIDVTIMRLVYHDMYWESPEEGLPRMEPAGFLKRIFSATRPGGVVAVIDHVAGAGGDTRDVVNRLHRIDPDTVKADFAAAGFTFDGSSDLLADPKDDHSAPSVDPAVRGRTDRFTLRFCKPG